MGEKFQEIYKSMRARQPSGVRKKMAGVRIEIGDMRDLEADTRHLFDDYDMGNGRIDIYGLRQVMRDSGLPDVDGDDYESAVLAHMQFADTNKDGLIDFEEFVGYRNAI